ncbi:MAG: YjbF family lipoprotein [Rhodobacteraceae bacterium]|nr:YjbF family lipoprotein [Paracoccaceae bacterium]PHQ71235.1 MAG: hypothetical protein COB93_03595 [Sneathiella sp.]
MTRFVGILTAATLLLTGCSGGLSQLTDTLFGRDVPANNARASLTRAQIDGAGRLLLLAELPELGLSATLAQVAHNGAVEVWTTADGVTLSLNNGVLVATRALGYDLISADVSGTLAALNGGGGADYPRIHSYLGGNGQTVFRSFICSLSAPVAESFVSFERQRQTHRYTETCHSSDVMIENTYWLGHEGAMWRARQWVGPEIGYLTTEKL